MTEVDVPDGSAAGVLSWHSTIHQPRLEFDRTLADFQRPRWPSGTLVIGFFDSDDGVAAFDHRVLAAYCWPVDVFAAHLAAAGLMELDRLQQRFPEPPGRRYAAITARAS